MLLFGIQLQAPPGLVASSGSKRSLASRRDGGPPPLSLRGGLSLYLAICPALASFPWHQAKLTRPIHSHPTRLTGDQRKARSKSALGKIIATSGVRVASTQRGQPDPPLALCRAMPLPREVAQPPAPDQPQSTRSNASRPKRSARATADRIRAMHQPRLKTSTPKGQSQRQ